MTIFDLKPFFSLSESAKRISQTLSEPFSERDVIMLAMDTKIRLSIDFVNHQWLRPVEGGDYPPKPNGEIIKLRGIFDLPMLPAARNYTAWKYYYSSDQTYTDFGLHKFYVQQNDVLYELLNHEGNPTVALPSDSSLVIRSEILKGFLNQILSLDANADNKNSTLGVNLNTQASLNDRQYLLRTIGALALLLIKKTNSNKFGTEQKPNKAGIYSAIQDLLSNLDSSQDGQSKSRLNDVLREGIKLVLENKQDF